MRANCRSVRRLSEVAIIPRYAAADCDVQMVRCSAVGALLQLESFQNLAGLCSAWTGRRPVPRVHQFCASLCSESSAVGAGGDAGVALEEAAEISWVLIADRVT